MTGTERLIERVEAKKCDIGRYITTETRASDRLKWLSILLGALTALFVGVPALGGATLLDVAGFPEGTPLWRLLLLSAAVLSVASTVVAASMKQRGDRIRRADAALISLLDLSRRLEASRKRKRAARPDGARIELEKIEATIPFVTGLKPRDFGKLGLDAEITTPGASEPVGTVLDCSGYITARRLPRDLHFWLMVEVVDPQGHRRVWPKEGEIYVAKDGQWKHRVFEDGGSPVFDLGLYVASREAHARIEEWINTGRTSYYRPVRGFPCCQRLHRVERLAIAGTSGVAAAATPVPAPVPLGA